MSVRVRICQIVGAVLLLGALGARATEQPVAVGTSSPVESSRALNGHVFQPSRLLTGPFSSTSFGMSTFFGAGTATAPTYNLLGNQTGTKDYDIADYGQQINADFRLTPDIALRLEVGGLVFSGTTGQGLLVAGATAQVGFLAGVTAGRDLGHDMRLSFVADFGLQPQLSLLIASAVLAAVRTGIFDSSGLYSNVERIEANPGASFAWAPVPAFGLVAEARYVWTRRVRNDGVAATSLTAQGVSLAGYLSLDLEPVIRWPIGFQAGWRSDLPVGSPGIASVNQATFGVYYTRRVKLALGLEAIWRHGAIREDIEPTLHANTATANLLLRYYW